MLVRDVLIHHPQAEERNCVVNQKNQCRKIINSKVDVVVSTEFYACFASFVYTPCVSRKRFFAERRT